MKKVLIALSVLMAVSLILAGCSKSEFGVVINDDFSVGITAENAAVDSTGMAGTFTVAEGQDVIAEPAFEKGTVLVQFYALDDELNEGNMEPEGDPVYEVELTGNEPVTCGFGYGDFLVKATVTEKADGSAVIRAAVEQSDGMANPWSTAETAEEAAKGAGVEPFSIDDTVLSLGEVKVEEYRYMDGIMEADIPIAAVEMTIRKGKADAAAEPGDISGDYNEYKYNWTQNIKGLEVNCFGNRKKEATKTIWQAGDYCYSITAYGAGGDDDFGLSADDLNTLINSIQ